MEQVTVQLVVATFEEDEAAEEALKQLKEADKADKLILLDAAVIRRDEKNKLHIKETADPGGGKGAAAGGTIGAVIGLFAGPPGVVIGASVGALVGGVTAKRVDSGIPDERLEQIGEGLQPGTSAVVGIVEPAWAESTQKVLADHGGAITAEEMRSDLPDQLGEDES